MFATDCVNASDEDGTRRRAGMPQRSCCPRSAARVLLASLVAVLGLLCLQRTAFAQTKIACIGDSITFGSGLANPARQSYPAVLRSLFPDTYQVRNYGVSGTTLLKRGDSPYWNTSAFRDSSAWNPDLVVIMLGTNDSKPQNWRYGDEFEGDYLDMIGHYASLPSAPAVYVCTPCPVYEPGNFGISPAVVRDEIVPLVWQIGNETGSPVIDVFTALSDHPELFPDRVHPNAEGAALIADTVWQALTPNGP